MRDNRRPPLLCVNVPVRERERNRASRRMKILCSALLIIGFMQTTIVYNLVTSSYPASKLSKYRHIFVILVFSLADLVSGLVLLLFGIEIARSKRVVALHKYYRFVYAVGILGLILSGLCVASYIMFPAPEDCADHNEECKSRVLYEDMMRDSLLWCCGTVLSQSIGLAILRQYCCSLEIILHRYHHDPFDGSQMTMISSKAFSTH